MIRGVYLILDPDQTADRPAVEVAMAALRGGVAAVQWRQKSGSLEARWAGLLAVRDLCRRYQRPFLVNDRVDVARELEADGAHVGQSDLAPAEARGLIPGKILGVSITEVAQIPDAESAGADYLGVGPIFPTASKDNAAAPGGLELLRSARQATSLPLVAIGGITVQNAPSLRSAGADAIAVISALCRAPDVEAAARDLTAAFEGVAVP